MKKIVKTILYTMSVFLITGTIIATGILTYKAIGLYNKSKEGKLLVNLDSIISLETKSEFSQINASSVVDDYQDWNSMVEVNLVPNISNDDFNKKFIFLWDEKEILNIDDDLGNIKIKLPIQNVLDNKITTKTFWISGFKRKVLLSLENKEIVDNEIKLLKLSLNKQLDIDNFNLQNFYSSLNAIENFDFKENAFISQKTKIQYQIKPVIESFNSKNKNMQVIIEARYQKILLKTYVVNIESKLFISENKKEFSNNWDIELKRNNGNALASFLFNTKNKNLFKVSSNIKNIDFINGAFDDQDGYLYLILTNNENQKKIVKLKTYSLKEITNKINNWNFILDDFNFETISKNESNIFNAWNNGNNYLNYFSLGKQIREEMNTIINANAKEYGVEEFESNYFSSIKKVFIRNNKLKVVFKNWSNEEFFIEKELPKEIDDKRNVIVDVNSNYTSFSKNEIFDEIGNRTMALIYSIEDEETGEISTISGTGWIFDKQDGSDTYYIATNYHVVDNLIKNKNNIKFFSYSNKSNKVSLDDLLIKDENDNSYFNDKSDDFITMKNIGFNTIAQKAFFDNLEVIPLSLHDNKTYEDFALIKVKIVDKKHKSKAMLHFDKNGINFFISDKVNWTQEDDNLNAFPMELFTSGYVGGKSLHRNSSYGLIKKWETKKKEVFDNQTYTTNENMIALPNVNTGGGASGSMVMNKYKEIVSIFWGGYFTKRESEISSHGLGMSDPIAMKNNLNNTILKQWLDQSKDLKTYLDKYENKINY